MRRAALVEVPLTPGALSDDTDLAAKLRTVLMDKVRFRGNRAETIKGWEAFNASGMSAGTARGIHSWGTLDGTPVVLAASESAVNAWVGGTRLTITPKVVDVFIDSGEVEFTNTTVTVDWFVYNPATDTSSEAPHFLQVGDIVTFAGVCSDNSGDYNPNGSFTITAINSTTSFTCASGGTNDPVEASPRAPAYVVTVPFRTGLATGVGDTAATRTRIYSISNYGENAVFCGSDGTPIWMWQPHATYPELLTNGTFTGNATGWTLGSGWSYSSNTIVNSGGFGYATQDISQALVGGKTYEMSFTVSNWAGGGTDDTKLDILIDTIKIHPMLETNGGDESDFNRTYTFRFICPANPELLKIGHADTGDGTQFTGTIDSVSIKVHQLAFPISQAPQKNYALFTDGNHVLHALGSVEADGDFNPLLWRWSAQDNPYDWIPDTDNISGELILGLGSYAVCGAQVGERIIILSDDSAFAGVFTVNGYSLLIAGTGCGGIGNRALAVHNNKAFWANKTGFYVYDGAQVIALDCPLKDQFVNNLAQYQDNKTFCWDNDEYGEIWVHFPHVDDGTEVSRYLLFNYLSEGNPWGFGSFDRTCFTRAGIYQHPIAIDVSDNIWFHEIGNVMSGDVVLPFLETGYFTGGAGDKWIGVRRYYPDIEQQVGNILYTVKGKRSPQGQNTTEDRGPFIMYPDQPTVDFFISARQVKQRWQSQESPTNWRLGVIGLEVVPERERR